MRSGRDQDQLNNAIHRHYVTRVTGDGAKTEYPIGKDIRRSDDLLVFVGGLLKVPAIPGTAKDYAIRGLTAGYAGDRNTVKFTAAPAVGVDIAFLVTAN